MSKFKKLVLTVAILAMTATGLSGCGGSGGASGSSEQLNIGVTSFADTLEPTEQYFSWVVMRYGVGETLVGGELGAGQRQPDLDLQNP